jgi:precorrin isomerase
LKNGQNNDRGAALAHSLYEHPMSGEAIEAKSFDIIDHEAGPHCFTPDQWEIVRRMIHTTADFSIMEQARFSADAVDSGIEALRAGNPIYVDSNMIRSGLSLEKLRAVWPGYGAESLICYVADAGVAHRARESGLPRSLFAVRAAVAKLNGAMAVFGNAPVALMELNRMIIDNEVSPALVVAMPVGFVHVVESKEELMSLGVPFIALTGRRGGSPLAVSVIHALCSLAARRLK